MKGILLATGEDYMNLGMQLMASVQNTNPLLFAVGVVLAVMSAFFGYRILKAWISVAGFIIGLLLGSGVAALCGLDGRISILVGLVVGAVLALVAFALYKIGVFFFVALCTMSSVMDLLNSLLHATDTAWWVVLAAFVIAAAAGYFSLRMVRPAVIVASSVDGGISLSTLLLPLFKVSSVPAILAVAAAISVAGAFWQFHTTKEMAKAEKERQEKRDRRGKKAGQKDQGGVTGPEEAKGRQDVLPAAGETAEARDGLPPEAEEGAASENPPKD